MRSMYEDVAKFHQQVLGLPDAEKPFLPDYSWLHERYQFLMEEVEEFMLAADAENLVGMADALLDTIYVALGTLHMMGIPVQQCWDAVQKANMAKVRGTTKRGNLIDARKPMGWVGPETEIRKAIEDAAKTNHS